MILQTSSQSAPILNFNLRNNGYQREYSVHKRQSKLNLGTQNSLIGLYSPGDASRDSHFGPAKQQKQHEERGQTLQRRKIPGTSSVTEAGSSKAIKVRSHHPGKEAKHLIIKARRGAGVVVPFSIARKFGLTSEHLIVSFRYVFSSANWLKALPNA